MQDFTKLEVWHRSLTLAVEIDRSARRFPRAGYGWLASQMRRASASIGANIAEGCGQRSQREFARFLQIAIASASEAQHHLAFATEIGLLTSRDHTRLLRELAQLRRMLSARHARVQESLQTENQSPTANGSRLP